MLLLPLKYGGYAKDTWVVFDLHKKWRFAYVYELSGVYHYGANAGDEIRIPVIPGISGICKSLEEVSGVLKKYHEKAGHRYLTDRELCLL